jgi:hypothetical protein
VSLGTIGVVSRASIVSVSPMLVHDGKATVFLTFASDVWTDPHVYCRGPSLGSSRATVELSDRLACSWQLSKNLERRLLNQRSATIKLSDDEVSFATQIWVRPFGVVHLDVSAVVRLQDPSLAAFRVSSSILNASQLTSFPWTCGNELSPARPVDSNATFACIRDVAASVVVGAPVASELFRIPANEYDGTSAQALRLTVHNPVVWESGWLVVAVHDSMQRLVNTSQCSCVFPGEQTPLRASGCKAPASPERRQLQLSLQMRCTFTGGVTVQSARIPVVVEPLPVLSPGHVKGQPARLQVAWWPRRRLLLPSAGSSVRCRSVPLNAGLLCVSLPPQQLTCRCSFSAEFL